jgi:predicted transcriptional regulator
MKERKNTIYKGRRRLIDESTGEVIEADELLRTESSQNFVKAYMSHIVMMLNLVGGKKIKVVNYILDNIHWSNNTLIATNREIAKKTGISYKTVADTLRILEESQIIKRKTGAIMLNPNLLLKGDESKKKYMLVKFEEFNDFE